MTSTIYLYYSSGISPRKNFVVESLSTYLGTLSKITLTDFQYIKHDLNIEIKVDMSQAYLEYKNANNIDYVAIKNSNENRVVYYFVMGKEWRGQSTIRFSLAMDTINTFSLGTDYELTNKTRINRQHKDRFTNLTLSCSWKVQTITDFDVNYEYRINGQVANFTAGWIEADDYNFKLRQRDISNKVVAEYTCDKITFYSGYFVCTLNGNYVFSDNLSNVYSLAGWYSILVYGVSSTANVEDNFDAYAINNKISAIRKIDLQSEGVSPILYGTDKGIIDDTASPLGTDYNGSTYLVYKGTAPLRAYLCGDSNAEISLSTANNTLTAANFNSGYYYYFWTPNQTNNVLVMRGIGSNGHLYDLTCRIFLTFGREQVRSACIYIDPNDNSKLAVKMQIWEKYSDGYEHFRNEEEITDITSIIIGQTAYYYQYSSFTNSITDFITGTSGSFIVGKISVASDSIEDIDRTASDLVKIIKLPYTPVDNLGSFSYDSTNKLAYLNNLETQLKHSIVTENNFNPLNEILIDLSNITTGDIRDSKYESKLLHSDYYQPKFVYDSFSFIFALERLDTDSFSYTEVLPINFVMTNTINSKFLFEFPSYIVDGKSTEDYPNILYVARNNEMVIFNSDYINYIRTGYNYDLKTKERQEAGLWSGVGLGIVGTIASFASSAVTGGLGIAAGISLATSTMTTLINAVNTTAQAEASMNQRLHQLRNQRASVSNADDVDLMTYYTNNKAKFMLYQVSDLMKSVLEDLFFYTGYIDGTMGIPDTTSRIRFNFVSCNPVFDINANIPEDIISDIEAKYNAGITFIHYYDGEWDLVQEYENWETFLFE